MCDEIHSGETRRNEGVDNYVITTATKFVDDNGLVVNDATKARSFKTAADAGGYISSHGSLLIDFGRSPIIVNEDFETVDSYG